jgi:hypothetical protein
LLISNAKILAIPLVVYIVSDLLLTPLFGVETRPVADVTTVGFITLGLLFVGLVAALVSLVLVFRSHRGSSMVAVIGALLYFPAFLADVSGSFSSLAAPSGIRDVEFFQGLVALLVIVVAGANLNFLRTKSKPNVLASVQRLGFFAGRVDVHPREIVIHFFKGTASFLQDFGIV